jgi:hypothetical protein
MWDVLTSFWNADWGFPELNPRQCWEGDEGPRTDLQTRPLPAWSPQDSTVAAAGL